VFRSQCNVWKRKKKKEKRKKKKEKREKIQENVKYPGNNS
jgi:hypothetical protein